ncbi:ABC-F family ATP-binding cassette domain-containing protein [Synechococcus sp. MIT S9220]|uniref:ABC-F family ATP-binding cassette domain-containing protein n=1 Tax=Synechococcus sp. MIT S9220 TaxID=166309 RepID=UPI00351C8BC7
MERGQASSIDGNYSAYLQRKADQEVSEAAEAARFKSVMRRELAWLRQGPKARSTKQKARIQRIEEMRAAPPKTNRSQLEMSSVSRRIGKLAIEAEQLTVTADGQVDGPVLLKDFTYSFSPEDRVGIIGPNGSGKSTLLDLIAGRRQATAGSLRLGETVHLGYLDQHTDALTEGRGLERKVIEFVEEAASRIDLGGEQLSASQLLERFLFPPAQQHSPLSKLSGGERRRLSLCRMLIQAPNVLLLDEPTNDLDVQTLSVLEDLLEDFRGCVVVVSHDRYFLDRTVDRLFCFEQGRLQRFEGNYSAFLDHRRNQEKSAAAEGNRNRSNEEQTSKELASKNQGPRRRSFKESRELESLEHELPQMEQRKADLEQAISSGQGDLTSLSHDLASLLEALETSEERWLELSELVP